MLPESGLTEIYVQPGESRMTTEPAVLRTLLGSCVAVAFLSVEHGVGALCHPMLPVCPEKLKHESHPESANRYVDFAIRSLAERFRAMGIASRDVTVKLFGGADVLIVSTDASRSTVGRLNSETALRVLAEEGFTVAASSLGGNSGITLEFNTTTGEVIVRRFNRSPAHRRHAGS
jgi:chemotaxis protein CheD